MIDLYKILTPIKSEAERKIKQQLSGIKGIVATPLYNSYMPLNVNVSADDQGCTLGFKTGGAVILKRGTNSKPDVTVQSNCQTLQELFTYRSRMAFEQAERNGDITITAHTQKGQTALSQIRNMFG